MKTIIKTLPIFLLSFYLSSCQKIIKVTPDDDPVTTFEYLWQELDKQYPTFVEKRLDWDHIYAQYRPLINSSTSPDSLWRVCCDMLEELNDNHVVIIDPYNDTFYVSGNEKAERAEELFSLNLIKEHYLKNDFHTNSEDNVAYGKIEAFGYIHISTMLADNAEESSQIAKSLDDSRALILDLRNNGGGNTEYAHRFAGPFVTEQRTAYTTQSKTGPGPFTFDAPLTTYAEVFGDYTYTKPIILLTDAATVSAGENFCVRLLTQDHVIHVGTNTAGALSMLSLNKHLPNKWMYVHPVEKHLLPNGECLEGVGITPDFVIENTPESIQNNTDLVLEYIMSVY